MMRFRQFVPALLAVAALLGSANAQPPTGQLRISCPDTATAGSALYCQTLPGATVRMNGVRMALADETGLAVLPLARTIKSPVSVEVDPPAEGTLPFARAANRVTVTVAGRKDAVSRFKMECGKIAAQTPEEKRHAEVSWLKKEEALKIFHDPLAPIGFAKPADGPYSSPFGAVRTYVPATKDCEGRTSVHNGLDIAIPTGTELRAPMAGTVILADPDLYYEGGAVFLDHGRGLVSVFMHMSRIDVKAGDVIEQNQPMGLSGATGRVTGPHLHWAIKYRNVMSADRGTDVWLDPALVMAAQVPARSAD
jgi:biotin carboxyl carrier protein